jgi:decaprenyl-phosphate phosphoribosyltransferase
VSPRASLASNAASEIAHGPEAGRPTRSLVRALVVTTRPKQWIKNLLVFAAPAAAGLLGRPSVLGRTTAAAAIFLGASAAVYLVNDVLDAPQDRMHPEKRHRPVAAHEISSRVAVAFAVVLFVAALAGAAVLSGVALSVVIATYIATSLSYSFWLKQVPVIELACVSAGFVLRAVAGGAAVHVPISPWFVIVTSSSALFVLAGKRSAEFATLGDDRAAHREVLGAYTADFLRFTRMIAASLAIISFCLWAFARSSLIDGGHAGADNIFFQLAILPFVLGILSVELAVESGAGGAPEELVLRNRAVQVMGVLCVACVAIGVYT